MTIFWIKSLIKMDINHLSHLSNCIKNHLVMHYDIQNSHPQKMNLQKNKTLSSK